MPDSTNVLFEAALQLPEDERLSLVSRILDTLPVDDLTASIDDPDLLLELERRFRDSEGAISWSELQAEG